MIFEHQPCLGGVHDTSHFYVECIVPVLPARSAKHQPRLGGVHGTSHLSVECWCTSPASTECRSTSHLSVEYIWVVAPVISVWSVYHMTRFGILCVALDFFGFLVLTIGVYQLIIRDAIYGLWFITITPAFVSGVWRTDARHCLPQLECVWLGFGTSHMSGA